jgi:CheY-like chemotaxis protein
MENARSSRILVVDDQIDTARGLEIILKLYGHDVCAVNDGKAAIEAARQFRPDFVILDIGMPGLDGYEVAATLKSDLDLNRAVIIGVSGYGREEDRSRSRDAGFDHHMVKPVDHKALIGLLAKPAGSYLVDSAIAYSAAPSSAAPLAPAPPPAAARFSRI